MSMIINTNIASENAVRILDRTTREMSTSMERLTSGHRINHSKDDAAGQAIVEGMNSQIRGTAQAIRNVNDGIGIVQTMDGAMEEVIDMFQRMRELGIQAITGTYNNENRMQMDAEFTQLQTEIDRIRQTTQFNNVTLFSTGGAVSIQAGWATGGNNRITLCTVNLSATCIQLSTNEKLTTIADASKAVTQLDKGLCVLNTKRANLGALHNRLEHTINNLQNVNENMKASRSRIEDADFATESAELARVQVLQQAGMSMLSQANQQPQNVMQLLQ